MTLELTDLIINEIGFVQTTSEELNSQDYRPFITDEKGVMWTINKEHLQHIIPQLLTAKIH